MPHEGLRCQIFRIPDVSRLRQVVSIDATDVTAIKLGKRLRICVGVLSQAGIYRPCADIRFSVKS